MESLDPTDAVKFVRAREIYETEIAERERDGTPIQSASYRVSVDSTLLRSVYAVGYFDEIAPDGYVDELTDDEIRTLIETLSKSVEEDEPNSSTIEEALKSLRTKMTIVNPDARIFQLALNVDMLMADVGFGKFRENNQKKAIELLTDHIHPPALKQQIKADLEFIPKIRKEWKVFLNHAVKQAEHMQRGLDSAARVAKALTKPDAKADGKKSQRSKPVESYRNSGKHSQTESGKLSRDLPKCLNEDCKELHYIKYCYNTSDEKKRELFEQFRENKKAAQAAKAVRKNAELDNGLHSALFRAFLLRRLKLYCAPILALTSIFFGHRCFKSY